MTNDKRQTTNAHDRGFVMVALLVGMAVAAIWMSAVLPAWRQQAQRQREEDLIFIGEQYARAIVLFQDKNRGALPPSIDVLVSQHYLRKKWKDPITNEDFVPLGTGAALPGGQSLPGSGQAPGQTPNRAGTPVTSFTPNRQGQPAAPGQQQPQQQQQQGQAVGITGVRSKSTAASIKIYQQQQQYSQWPFDAAMIRARMGRLIPSGGNQPGRPGGPNDRGGQGPGAQPGRVGQPVGPGGTPVRPGGGAGGGPPVGPPGGRAGGSF